MGEVQSLKKNCVEGVYVALLSLYVLVLNPHLEHQSLEFNVHLSLHFLMLLLKLEELKAFSFV